MSFLKNLFFLYATIMIFLVGIFTLGIDYFKVEKMTNSLEEKRVEVTESEVLFLGVPLNDELKSKLKIEGNFCLHKLISTHMLTFHPDGQGKVLSTWPVKMPTRTFRFDLLNNEVILQFLGGQTAIFDLASKQLDANKVAKIPFKILGVEKDGRVKSISAFGELLTQNCPTELVRLTTGVSP